MPATTAAQAIGSRAPLPGWLARAVVPALASAVSAAARRLTAQQGKIHELEGELFKHCHKRRIESAEPRIALPRLLMGRGNWNRKSID